MFDYQAPKDLLQDKVILVTGAGGGIGRAAALAYAEHGATVILLGRTTENLEAVYDEIEAQGYPQPAIFPMNLESATEHDFQALADVIETEFGRLDGLLNNAGTVGDRAPLSQYEHSTWNRVMQVNLNAHFFLTQALLPLLEQEKHTAVIFTSSGVGREGRAYWGAYAVSKFATEGLVQVMADELGGITNIRINAINPGATRTQMRAFAYPSEDPYSLPAPEEIMPLYLYLMGQDGKDCNGQSLDAQD